MVRNSTLVQVKLNGTEYFRKSISAAKFIDAQVNTITNFTCLIIQLNCPGHRTGYKVSPTSVRFIPSQVLYLGGPPPIPQPPAPEAMALTVSAPAVSLVPAPPSPSAPPTSTTVAPTPPPVPQPDDSAYFKGVIQDVQVRARSQLPSATPVQLSRAARHNSHMISSQFGQKTRLEAPSLSEDLKVSVG